MDEYFVSEEDAVVMGEARTQTATAMQSTWSRRFVLTGAVFLVIWQGAVLLDVPRSSQVALGVYGFVFHVIFGKAYALIPSYFDRQLAFVRAPMIQYPLSVIGVTGLGIGPLLEPAPLLDLVAGTAWFGGVLVFVGTIVWTIRGNITGADTATGGVNQDRQRVDRIANAFVPIVFVYLVVGSYELFASTTGLPVLFDGYAPRSSHLIAAGTAVLLLFAIGFRLLPRFMVASPPTILVVGALLAGAVGPVVIAATLPAGRWFLLGAIIETIAIVSYAIVVIALFVRSDRRRVGFPAIVVGSLAGVVAVFLGLEFAFVGILPSTVTAHVRLNTLGFLGLSIIGVTYQFYPPAIGTSVGANNRSAKWSIGLIASGIAIELAGVFSDLVFVTIIGRIGVFVGAALFLYLVSTVMFASR